MSKKGKLEVTIGGIRFVAEIPETEHDVVEARHLALFERWVVKMLCQFGEPSRDGLRFLRTRSRLKASELVDLIGVSDETISRWENGKNDMPVSTWELMVTIAEEHVQGRSDTIDSLRKRREQRQTHPKRLLMDSREMKCAVI